MAYTEFYINPSSAYDSNLNSGSTNGAPVYSSTGGNWNNSTFVFTPTDSSTPSSSVSTGMFASIYTTSGATVATYIARITAVGSGTNGTITVSNTNKAGTAPTSGSGTVSIIVGGPWTGPSGSTTFPLSLAISGTTLVNSSSNPARISWQNSQTYSMTAAISDSTTVTRHEGFNSSPGDGGIVTLSGGNSGTSYVLLTAPTTNAYVNFIFSGNGSSGSANLVAGTNALFINCVFTGSVGNGLSSGKAFNCEAYGNNTSNTSALGGFNSSSCFYCVSHHNNTGSNCHGFVLCSTIAKCVAAYNAGNGFFQNPGYCMYGCVSYGNSLSGWNNDGNNANGFLVNCSFENNSQYGYVPQGGTLVYMANCSFYNNTSGMLGGTTAAQQTIFQINTITPTASTMVSPSTGNFALNNNTGGGALLRAAGYDWEIVYQNTFTSTTEDYSDVGAAQSQAQTIQTLINRVVNHWIVDEDDI